MQTLLEVDNLSIGFGASRPVRNLSLSVAETQTLAVVGESGSGKSLTALSLMRLLPPAARIVEGSVRFEGRELTTLPDHEMRSIRGRDIAMIFQEPMTSLNPVMTVGRQIAESVRLHEKVSARAGRARAVELLDLVRIPDPHRRVDDYPHQLSGGMRQRVMIAIAVACRPRLLIADEPTTALDVTIQAQILELLDRLRRELKMALVLITHDLGVVGQWADRVVVMYAGRKVEEGVPQEVFPQPMHPYTQGLLSASPRAKTGYHYRDGRLQEIRGSIATAQGGAGCPFAPRCDYVESTCQERMPEMTTLAGDRRLACFFPCNTSPMDAPHAAIASY